MKEFYKKYIEKLEEIKSHYSDPESIEAIDFAIQMIKGEMEDY